jgi:WD40 repeat protein
MALAARTLGTDKTDLALLLGAESYRSRPSIETEGALEGALVHSPAGLEQVIRFDAPIVYPNISPDGHWLAVPEGNRVQLWDLSSRRLARTLTGPASSSLAALFNRDATLIADGRSDAKVYVWDVATGRQVGTPLPAPGGGYGLFDPTDTGRMFVVGSNNTVVRWDRHMPDRPVQIGEPLRFGGPSLEPTAYISPDGRRLAAGCACSGPTSVWDIGDTATHPQPLPTLVGAPSGFGPDGVSFATSGGDHVTLWNTTTGAPQTKLTGFKFAGRPTFSPDGSRLAVDESSGPILVFDLATHQQIGPPLAFHASGGRAVGFLGDGRLVTAGASEVAIWRIGLTVPPLGVTLSQPPAPVLAPFGRTEVVTYSTGSSNTVSPLLGWDGVTGQPLGRLPDDRAGPRSPVSLIGVALSPDTTSVATVGTDGKIHLWDETTGEPMSTLDGARGGEIGASWDTSGRQMATVGLQDQSILLWDVSDVRKPALIGRLGDANPPTGQNGNAGLGVIASFSHDDRLLVSENLRTSMVSLFDVATRTRKWTKDFPIGLAQVTFSPDDRTLAVNSGETVVTAKTTLIDIASGAERVLRMGGFSQGVEFVQGGRVLVTTSAVAGGVVAHFWDTATFQPIGEPFSVPADGAPMYRNADGTRFTTSSLRSPGFAVLWSADPAQWETTACRIAGRNMTRAEWHQYQPDRPYRTTCPQWPNGV